MSFILGVDRSQTLLLPESVEEYVDPEHPVRFLDAFVDGLDLAACGFARTEPADTGRPPFAPADLLKLYLWGYLNKVRSSRRLELECGRNLEVLWLLRKLQPDFKTIADFRRDNAKAFKAVFREFHLLCRDLELFGGELVAIDGTKLKAVNNVAQVCSAEKLRARLERIDARLVEFLATLEAGDRAESAAAPEGATASKRGAMERKIAALCARQQRYQEALAALAESGEKEISLTDADSRRMRKVGVGYNGQIAVDAKHKLIVVAEVVNEPTDHEQLAPMAAAAKEALDVKALKAVADGGYYDHGQIAACAEAGVESYLPRPKKGSAEAGGRFGKEQFAYEAASDTYRCPRARPFRAKSNGSSEASRISPMPTRKPAGIARAKGNAPRGRTGASPAGRAKRSWKRCTRGWRPIPRSSRSAKPWSNIPLGASSFGRNSGRS